jgi:hypothetical protein
MCQAISTHQYIAVQRVSIMYQAIPPTHQYVAVQRVGIMCQAMVRPAPQSSSCALMLNVAGAARLCGRPRPCPPCPCGVGHAIYSVLHHTQYGGGALRPVWCVDWWGWGGVGWGGGGGGGGVGVGVGVGVGGFIE